MRYGFAGGSILCKKASTQVTLIVSMASCAGYFGWLKAERTNHGKGDSMKLTMKLLALFFGIMLMNTANAESPRAQFNQMVTQLQGNANDDALREKIIKQAQKLKPVPVVSEEVKRRMALGTTALENARTVTDYQNAAKEFEQATLAAPWYGDAYLNLGVAQDKAENYDAALRNLKFAQLASPDEKWIKASIDQVEIRKKKAQVLKEEAAKGPAMVRIPNKNYEIGKYEVTQAEWRAVMGNNPSNFSNCGDTCPVEQVNWDDIQTFLQKLNAKSGRQYRLPTEAEWEYACYGGNQTEYCGGNDLNEVAWTGSNSENKTHPVGQKKANGFGLYDMTGNVWERMNDCWEGDCTKRVLRGGSWNFRSETSRAAFRSRFGSATRYVLIGFRLARTLP
jgi:tetratricopeptide (TPR) repeat protein